MKRIIDGFFMCWGNFCAIPCPYRPWDEKARWLMLALLPLLGALLGGLWWALDLIMGALSVPVMLRAAALTAYPYWVTGGIHLDGFMDTSDAIGSWRPLNDRLRILKDPHVGASAVMAVALMLMIHFGSAASAITRSFDGRLLIFIPAITRAAAAVAVTVLKPLTHSQFAENKAVAPRAQWAVPAALGAAALIAAIWIDGGRGFAVIVAAAAGYALALWRTYKMLGGVSGDLSGYALTLGEVCAWLVMALWI